MSAKIHNAMTRRDLMAAMATLALGMTLPRTGRADAAMAENPNARFPDTTTAPNLHYWYPLPPSPLRLDMTFDVCIYGATPAGIAAAVQLRRMGRTPVLLSFDRHLGGMTSSGLGATDAVVLSPRPEAKTGDRVQIEGAQK